MPPQKTDRHSGEAHAPRLSLYHDDIEVVEHVPLGKEDRPYDRKQVCDIITEKSSTNAHSRWNQVDTLKRKQSAQCVASCADTDSVREADGRQNMGSIPCLTYASERCKASRATQESPVQRQQLPALG